MDGFTDVGETFHSVRAERDAALGELGRLRGLHAVYVEGPLRYPGGKDGMYVLQCTCGQWTSRPYTSPVYRELWAAARDHQVTKRGL